MERIGRMRDQMTLEGTVRALCRAWFEERDVAGTMAFLSDDVHFVGTGENEFAVGTKQMEQYLRQDIAEIPEPFACELGLIQEQELAESLYSMSWQMTLKNPLYSWHLRCFMTLLEDGRGRWQIKSLHFAEPSGSQQGDEHYPKALVMENIARQRQELINDSLLGGMMGGYIEEGFPFYFINQQMLRYLGYESEEQFVSDIGGMISNCMHPQDREMVDGSVAGQLEEKGEYVVEYRMKKRDGSYIWVHDLGRRLTAEDGRPAIASVCVDITPQREAQEEVLHLYNNIPGAVFRCRYDEHLSVISANDGLFEFLGYTREEFAVMGNRMSAVIFSEDLPWLFRRLAEQLRDGNNIHTEHRLICQGGRVKWGSVKAQLLTEQSGERYFYCVCVDATEEKKLQERMRELYDQELAYFTEHAAAEGSVQGRVNVTQNRVESHLSNASLPVGQTKGTYDQAIENMASSALDPACGEGIRRTLAREKVLSDFDVGKVDYRFEFLRRSGDDQLFWSNTGLRSCRDPESGDVVAFFYTMDVTEQKLQEELLKRIAAHDYDSVTEVDILRDAYRMLFFNGSRNRIPYTGEFQKEIRALAGRFMDESAREVYLKNLDYGYVREQLEQRESYSFVAEMKNEAGDAQVKRFQVFYISRELGRVCLTRTDVTDVVRQEQRQKEELATALIAAKQANAAKSDFLSRMSHEIRTPMNAIIGMSTIAAQAIGDDEQVADCISKIGISSRFLLSLINDILDMSRIESGKMLLKNEKIPTEEFLNGLNSICHAQASAKELDYECVVDPLLDDYYIGDAMKLQQVLINVLSNAIKFTGEGGKVTFSVSQHRRGKGSATLRFVVNDTGIGMDEEFLPHIFEAFSQESAGTTALFGGTGLGLAIAKNIVDMMGGRIDVRSIKGIGTEFTVDVKLGLSGEEKPHHQKKHSYNFSHLKTLVVDDDVAVCESAVVTLLEMGVKAEWVDSGHKAVEQVRRLWAGEKYYDMILIDWKMPDMDGIETARRIRAIVGEQVTIIIMTAYDWISIEHEAKLAGVNLLMSKPMFKSSLVSAFSKALGEKEEAARPEEHAGYDFTGKRVLLAEDNLLNTEVAVLLLESKGFKVEAAENGLRAMELFSKSARGYYDAILMDIRMPLMDGLTAASNIRHLSNADAKTIPIIAMTANAFDDDIDKSKAAGMNAHLAKPIDPGRLYQTLYDFICKREEEENEQFQGVL